jgi:alpha-tubulin suppressor-like RCC1 family protein
MPGNRECFMRGAPTEPSAEVGVESIELACRRLERSTATGVPITTQTSRVALDAERNVWRVGATVVMEPLPGFGKVDAVASTNDVSCAHSARGPLSCVYHPEPIERPSLGFSASAVPGVDCVEQMVSGWQHLCAQTCEGQTLCFGSNLEGQLGQPKPAELGTNFVDLQHVTQLSAGADHTCALTREGTVYCWGASDDARLSGDAQGRVYARPVQVPLPAAAKLVSTSSTRSCALLVDGQAYCWGLDYHGPVFVELPTRVPGIDSAQQLEPGINHSCALVDGEVWCWGETVYPERANWQPLEPTRIAGIADAIQISVGNEHACALDRHGSTRCWGRLRFAKEDRVAGPTLFPLLPKAVQLRARSEGACARTADGEVHCAWGPEQKARQIDVGMAIDLIGLEQSKLCAITQELQVRCADNLGPQNLTDLGAVRQVAVGKGHVCALRTDGRVQCVGANHRGQLGAGELLFSLHPVEVTLPSRGRSLQ